jgi:hypothetical protein
VPVRVNDWAQLAKKTRDNYISVWGTEAAARKRYEAGQPMRREGVPLGKAKPGVLTSEAIALLAESVNRLAAAIEGFGGQNWRPRS